MSHIILPIKSKCDTTLLYFCLNRVLTHNREFFYCSGGSSYISNCDLKNSWFLKHFIFLRLLVDLSFHLLAALFTVFLPGFQISVVLQFYRGINFWLPRQFSSEN